jgi:protein SCO1/2
MQARIVVLLSVFATLLIPGIGQTSTEKTLPIHDGVGGEFTAQSSLGREVSLSEYRGRVVLISFGYTSCQDICPATMAHLQSLLKRLDAVAEHVQVLFVTVDPENDTSAHLEEYLARFDSRFVGLTGKRDETDRIADLFLVKSDRSHGVQVTTEYNRSKAFAKHSYLYAHSQQIYLLDKAGRTRALFFTGSPLDEMEGAVLSLLKEPADRPTVEMTVVERVVEHDSDSADCSSGGMPCPDSPAGHHKHEGTEERE